MIVGFARRHRIKLVVSLTSNLYIMNNRPEGIRESVGLRFNVRHPLNALLIISSLLLLLTSCGDDDDGKTDAPQLAITSISPDRGGEGTEVDINGTGFSKSIAENNVVLNSKACEIVTATETLLKIKIPANAGTGKIVVTVGGVSVESATFTFIPPAQALAITSIAPTTGPRNTSVVITGTGFGATPGENTVTLNGKSVTVINASSTQLSITIPAGSGSGAINVSVGGKTVESQKFEYVFTTTVGTLAGSTYGYAEGTGAAAQFAQPYNVAVDKDGNVYVADTNNHSIRKITASGETTTLAGGTQGSADGTGAAAQFNYPYGVTVGSDGNIYVADTHNHKVRKITPGGVVSTFAGSTGGYNDATGTDAQFYYLTGIAADQNGNLYVADKDNNKIRKITSAGVVTTLAGSTGGYAEGTGTAAQFSSPYNVAVDATGNVYVADANNHRIRKITPAGEVTTFAGSAQGDAVGAAADALFNYPYAVTIDSNGNLFVADTFNQKVKKIDTAGQVTNFAGSTNGYADGEASAAQFNYPTGIAVKSSGTIIVSDKDSHKIRIITVD